MSKPFLIAVSFLTILNNVIATCHFPNGVVASADVACDASASDSFCCFSGQACMSNKLCLTEYVDGIPQYARGTCTDPNWESGACPNFCLDAKNNGNPVISCNTSSDSYCCDTGCSCDAGSDAEVLNFAGAPYTITVIGVHSSYPTPGSTASTLSSQSAIASTTSTTSSSSISGTGTSTTAETSSTSSTNNNNDNSNSNSNSSGVNGKGIGIGVGIGVGVALLAIIAGLFILRQRRRRKASRAPNNSNLNEAPPYGKQELSGTSHPRSLSATELGSMDRMSSKHGRATELPI